MLLVCPSLRRVAWSDFPSCARTTADSDSSPFFPASSVDLDSGTHAELLRSLRTWVQLSPACSLVLGHRVTAPGICMGKTEVSQVPGEPVCTRALLLDSGGSLGSHPTDPRNIAFRLINTVGLHTPGLSELNHTAHVLAVYALPRESPHAAQDSLLVCWLGTNEVGLSPTGFQILNFKKTCSSPFPSDQAWPGALIRPPYVNCATA